LPRERFGKIELESAELEDCKTLVKKPRGSFDYAFDEESELSVVKWNDNSVVIVASNTLPVFPLGSAKRLSRK
jgi:hypothetical protein